MQNFGKANDIMLICPDCFYDSGLQRRIIEIRPKFPDKKCEFHPNKKGIPISEVAKIVDEVFRNLYTFSLDTFTPGYFDNNLIETLYELTGADDHRVIEALANSLIENDVYWPPNGEEAFYEFEYKYDFNEKGYEEHSLTWRLFRKEILHEQRFFNEHALNRLNEIFDGLHLIRNEKNKPAVDLLIPGSENAIFHRARVSNDPSERNQILDDPATNLGPPPEHLRTAGRMNSSGIMAFYGAFDLETCIAELRPVAGETVVAAKFALNRPILVLDTTGFSGSPKLINVFARTHIKRMRLWNFMTEFMHEIARPCLPDDEHLDYVPTQVVSEYLTHLHKLPGRNGNQTIDGIIYRSAQNRDGKNIAIFGDAGVVQVTEQHGFRGFQSKTGLKYVEGSATSHEVKGVMHNTEEVYIPDLDDGITF